MSLHFSETPHAAEFSRFILRMFALMLEGPFQDNDGAPGPKVLLASPALVFVNAVCLHANVILAFVCPTD